MEYTIPHYFEQFRCVAAQCEDTCCAGWAIMIDEDSLEKYQQYSGPFRNRLHNSIDWKEGSFCQYEGRCAFLNESNLCDLHIEAGEHMLCDTCRDYPRHLEEFEGVREGSLSLSCLEAAKLILGCKEPVRFVTFHDDEEDEEYEDFDYLLYTKLVDARTEILALLQNRKIDIRDRISMVLDFTERMQGAIDHQELFQIDEMLQELSQKELQDACVASKSDRMGVNEYSSNMRKLFRTFQKLETLKSDWPEYVKKAEFLLYSSGRDAYTQTCKKFHQMVGWDSNSYETWSVYLEQLMVYFVFTYFCGAVYDDNALGKMKLSVVSTLLIQELCIAKWVEEKESLSFADVVDMAHRVSREIEHSDINPIRLEKLCDKSDILQTKKLIQILQYDRQ